MKSSSIVALFALCAPISAGSLIKRAITIPASKGKETFSSPKAVSGTFDGGMKTYGRGVSCTGQAEGGSKDAVFILANGATLKNAIIGADQIEGVYCSGSCTIENVLWTKVCEDALSIKGDGNANVIGGGARDAADKVIQHNGSGTVTIDGFTVEDFGKLYRSCGTCGNKKRNVIVKNVKAYKAKSELVGINTNFGDTATITNTCAKSVKNICQEYTGTSGGEPKKNGNAGPSSVCKYSASDITTDC